MTISLSHNDRVIDETRASDPEPGILEDIIEGAVMQEAHKVLDGAQFIQEQDGNQSTTSTSTTTTTTALSSFDNVMKGNEGGDRKGM